MTMVLVVLIVCATTVGLAVLLRPRPQPPVSTPGPSILDERLLDFVVVTLLPAADGNVTTFGGVLYVEDRGAVVLAKAEQYMPDGTRVTADGEIIFFRDRIDFIQRP